MAIWRAFIDDSASEGAVLKYDFSAKPIQRMDGKKEIDGAISPSMAAGIVVIKGSNLSPLIRELNALRREIRDRYKLSTDYLPVFHMRHLWGETANSDEGKNPFVHLSPQERFQIAKSGYEFLARASERHGLVVSGCSVCTENVQLQWGKFFSNERTIMEKDIIFSRFKSHKRAKQFYNRVLNPAMGLVAELMHLFDEYCHSKDSRGIIKYDSSDASKGFESDELYDVLHQAGMANNISQSSHGVAEDECLLQLADMVSYREFKFALDISRGHNTIVDPNFLRVLGDSQAQYMPISSGAIQEKSLPTHFLSARQFLEGIDPSWVNAHMRTADELAIDMSNGVGESQGGAHILRDSTVDYYRQHGRLP